MSLKDKIIKADNKAKDNGFYWEADVEWAIFQFKKYIEKCNYFEVNEVRNDLEDKFDKIFGDFEERGEEE